MTKIMRPGPSKLRVTEEQGTATQLPNCPPNDMLIKIGFDIEFELRGPTPMVLMLFVHPSRENDLRRPEELQVEPDLPVSYYTDLFGNRCARLLAPAGNLRLTLETLIEDSGELDPQSPDAVQHNIEKLPDDTLAFLMPSRYCEVDKLSEVAWKLFGETPPGWPRVKAICDWVHQSHHLWLSLRRPIEIGFRRLHDRRGGLPRFQSSRAHLLPLSEHSGALCHRLHGRHRRSNCSADGFQRLV